MQSGPSKACPEAITPRKLRSSHHTTPALSPPDGECITRTPSVQLDGEMVRERNNMWSGFGWR
eukprot:572683-Rhodomonas_salina.1